VEGEIVLRGSVPDRRTKRLAEDAIENLPGVKDVRNELRASSGKEGTDSSQLESGPRQSGKGGA
jgi:hypothetical protein